MKTTWDTDEVLRWIMNCEGLYIDIVKHHLSAEDIFNGLDLKLLHDDLDLDKVDWDYVNDEVQEMREEELT